MKRSMMVFVISCFSFSGVAYANNTYQIDSHNRFILNGEAFFPLGLYVVQCANGSYSTELDEISDSPFDTLMNYAINGCGSDATVEQINTYLDEVESRNLKVIFSFQEYFSGCFAAYEVCDNPDILDTTGDIITQKVAAHKYHDALLAWYLYEEVCPDCLTQLGEGYGLVKALDTDHPVWTVHWNTNWLLQETHTTDIVGVDPYPIDNHPITLVSQMADAASSAGKPLWLVPQIFDWRDYPWDPRSNTGRPPTKEEMRAMSYLATNHGAKGLIYYSYFNIRDDADYAVRWQEIKDIATEIDTLRPVFMSTEETQIDDVICDNENIDIKLMKKDDTYYLFAVNTREVDTASVSFNINLADKPTSVNTLFEDDGPLTVSNGAFTDGFSIYEVHVYWWEASLYPSPDIKANGSDGPVDIALGDALSITIELEPGDYQGYQADWWVLADAPFGWYYYDDATKQWLPGFHVSYQGPLFALTPADEVLNVSDLPVGSYDFYFGIDGWRNGRLDQAYLYYDSVEVNITP